MPTFMSSASYPSALVTSILKALSYSNGAHMPGPAQQVTPATVGRSARRRSRSNCGLVGSRFRRSRPFTSRRRASSGSRIARRWPPIRPGGTEPVSRNHHISFTAAASWQQPARSAAAGPRTKSAVMASPAAHAPASWSQIPRFRSPRTLHRNCVSSRVVS